MRSNIHDWMDGGFLSLSENPEKLDKYITRYEHTRIICLICMVGVLAMYLLAVFKSSNNPEDYGFMFSLVVFMLVINVQTDIFTKVLKLQRQQQNRDTKDAKPLSGIHKKSSISEIALIYCPVLLALILGILILMFLVMAHSNS